MKLFLFICFLLINKSNSENLEIFLSKNDRTVLYVLPIFHIDPVKQIELSTDFEISQIKIPIVHQQISHDIRTKLFAQISNQLQTNVKEYKIQTLPLDHVQITWKNQTEFFHSDFTLDLNRRENDTNLFITINCKTLEKCYAVFSRLRQDTNLVMKNIRFVYARNSKAYQPMRNMRISNLIEKNSQRTRRDVFSGKYTRDCIYN